MRDVGEQRQGLSKNPIGEGVSTGLLAGAGRGTTCSMGEKRSVDGHGENLGRRPCAPGAWG